MLVKRYTNVLSYFLMNSSTHFLENYIFLLYLPNIVFKCLNREFESFLKSCIFSVDFLTSALDFFVNMLTFYFYLSTHFKHITYIKKLFVYIKITQLVALNCFFQWNNYILHITIVLYPKRKIFCWHKSSWAFAMVPNVLFDFFGFRSKIKEFVF